MIEKDFIPSYDEISLKGHKQGKMAWKSPSNIALIKYWGKKDNQIPANPSLSFTLDACATETRVSYRQRDTLSPDFSFELLFEGRRKNDFRPKVENFFRRIEKYLPFLLSYHFIIETSNSFPHSSGIASSASGMSALALCLMSIEKELAPKMDDDFFVKKASFLARLGSGSACRSIEGELVQWGHHTDIKGSSDLYGIKYPYPVHDLFTHFQDTILLVDQGQKQISSTVGHDLMHDHPFAKQRFAQAHRNLADLRSVLRDGDMERFIRIVENEALTLHAMMMTSYPSFILMKPNTLEIIQKIWTFREVSKANLCFTLDAGANVHLLYPKREKEKIYGFIKDDLLRFCENGNHICDSTGLGAKKIYPDNDIIG